LTGEDLNSSFTLDVFFVLYSNPEGVLLEIWLSTESVFDIYIGDSIGVSFVSPRIRVTGEGRWPSFSTEPVPDG
jgi:hypothetical protein